MEHSIGQEPDPLNDLAIAASIMLCRGGEAVQHCVKHLSDRYQSAIGDPGDGHLRPAGVNEDARVRRYGILIYW